MIATGTRTHEYNNSVPCAGTLVEHRGQILMLRRAQEPFAGSWDLPGGHCEFAEHPSATAVRETREELGLEIRITGLFGVYIDRTHIAMQRASLIIYYTAVPSTVPPTLRAGTEAIDGGWFETSTIPEELAFPEHLREVLRDWKLTREVKRDEGALGIAKRGTSQA